MTDEQKEQVEPIKIAVIAGGPTGPGTTMPSTGTVLPTPGAQQPNVVVQVVMPLVAILVRFLSAYLTALVGLVGAGMTPLGGKLLYTTDFYHMVLTCASLAVAGPAFGVLKDFVTIFSGLEKKFPLLGV